MALTLDSRHRAMLHEMGITVWLPAPDAAALRAASAPAQALADAPPAEATPRAQPMAAAPVAVAVPAAPAPVRAPAAVTAPAATEAVPQEILASDTMAWQITEAVRAYPQASGGSPAQSWLVVWEAPEPSAPLGGDSGKLLDNMLRALGLQHSAHVWLACVQRPDREALPVADVAVAPVALQPLESGLPQALHRSQPARVLLLGVHAARAVLGRSEALGRLRAQVHTLGQAQVPAVVSYDPAYLLRAPHAKPAAWADLCRAHALRPPAAH